MSTIPDLSLEAAGAFLRAAGLRFDQVAGDLVVGTIEATEEHHTPWGTLHGGLHATAIESACSVGASAAVADRGEYAVGLSNHTEFLRAHREGALRVEARPVHRGRTGQLWQCDITRADGKLVARGLLRLQNVPRAAE